MTHIFDLSQDLAQSTRSLGAKQGGSEEKGSFWLSYLYL